MSKELWIRAHEQLVDEYLEAHPEADWTEAYEATTGMVDARVTDKIANMIDEARDRAKYEGVK